MQREETWADLAAARSPALLRLAVMLTGDPHQAQDLVQDTLARAHKHGARIAAMDAPAAYLRTVLVREHVSWRRRVRRTPSTAPLTDDAATAAGPGERHEVHDALWRALATLPPKQRAVLALRYYDDLTDPEIADALGCSPGTVRSHASRALATLRADLAKETW